MNLVGISQQHINLLSMEKRRREKYVCTHQTAVRHQR
jgi:hypothetical protein